MKPKYFAVIFFSKLTDLNDFKYHDFSNQMLEKVQDIS
jgi:hypothetical protein